MRVDLGPDIEGGQHKSGRISWLEETSNKVVELPVISHNRYLERCVYTIDSWHVVGVRWFLDFGLSTKPGEFFLDWGTGM